MVSPLPAPAPAFKAGGSPSSAAPSAAGADSDGALAREASWIDQARHALARHDASEAARALAIYDASRRVGVLDREALLLRVELSVIQGDVERARSLAERYRATYPGDAHLPRLQALLARVGVSP
jgi:outer membrane protein assembly factor BamD (BamD/ComL family)